MFAGPCIIGQLCMQLPFLRNFNDTLATLFVSISERKRVNI